MKTVLFFVSIRVTVVAFLVLAVGNFVIGHPLLGALNLAAALIITGRTALTRVANRSESR